MLNRRAFLCGAISTAIALPVASAAQPARKTARIGWIAPGPGPTPAQLDVFRRGMRERGWIEGQNLVLDVRGGDRERARELVAELVRQHVDVIVTEGPMALGALGESVSTPLVFVVSGDPVEAGLVSSITRPGTNLTGLTLLSLDLVGKRLELLKETLPTLSRVAILANQEHPGVRAELRESQAAAERLGLRAQYVPVRGVGDFDGAFQEIARERADAIVAFPDNLIMRQAAAIAAFAAKRGIPAVSGWAGFAIAGNLLSYGPNIDESFRIIATQVDKILRGARPGDLPIEQPSKFQLVINLKTARALGLTIPPSLLLRADQVIE